VPQGRSQVEQKQLSADSGGLAAPERQLISALNHHAASLRIVCFTMSDSGLDMVLSLGTV
jgi:hypothetical protein